MVRHGQTTWNKSGRFQGQNQVSLNVEGVQQAHSAARKLNSLNAKFLYSSPLPRAMETAGIIGSYCNLPTIQSGRLMELNLGELDGITSGEMKKEYPDTYKLWRSDPSKVKMPNGESLVELQNRMWSQVMALGLRHHEDEIIAVSHNFAISATLCRMLNIPLSNFHRIGIDLGSISTIEKMDDNWRIISLNKGFQLTPISCNSS